MDRLGGILDNSACGCVYLIIVLAVTCDKLDIVLDAVIELAILENGVGHIGVSACDSLSLVECDNALCA